MRIMILLIVVTLSINTYSQDVLVSKKKEKIEHLLEVTGSLKIGAMFGKVIVNQMNQAYQKMGTAIPDTVLQIMEEEVGILIDNEMKLKSGLVDQLCAIYDKYYNEEDIDAMLQFYSTETGKKIIETLPNVIQESMLVGQQWGMQKGPELAEKLKERLIKKGINLIKM